MSRRAAKETNYAEDDGSDLSGSELDDSELLDSEIGVEFEPEDDDMDLVEDDDDFEVAPEEILDDEDRPIKVRGRYKQPGVKVLKQTSRQILVRLRFGDKYAYASIFGEPPEELKQLQEAVKVEEAAAPKMPKSVMVLIDPRTKAQKLSEQELQLKKAEATRKRKHFIARKLELEKKETLERLLLKKETKSASVGPDSDSARKEIKKRVLLTHKALFSWSSKTETTESGTDRDVSYYSMVI